MLMKGKCHCLFLCIVLMMLGCGKPRQKVDMIITNCKIYTMTNDSLVFSSMAIDKGKIMALGSDKEISEQYVSDSVKNFTGKFIYPGFIDAHSHFYGLGQSLSTVDLREVKSEDELVKKVQDFYSVEKPAGSQKPSSIWGRGWDQNLWPSKKFPTNHQLNVLYPDVPVCLIRIDGHAALVNQKALDLAGITDTSRITGGEFVKENGKLTGVLIDNAVDLVKEKLPKPSKEEQRSFILKAQQECLKYGLTTVCDAGLDKDVIDLYDEMHQSGELQIRVYAMANPTQPTLNWLLQNGPYKTERLHVHSVKYYMDGAMGSRGACLLEDYADKPGHRGFLLNPVDSLKDLAIKLRDKKIQLNVHCIGDSTNRIVLRIMSEVLGNDTTSRWRIEHVQLISEPDLNYFRKWRIIPSMQPTHATSDAPWVTDGLGKQRMRYAYALLSCLRASGTIALGTDFPVEEVNPFYTLYAAISRKHPVTQKSYELEMSEKLSRYQTLQGMTISAAYAQFEESEKGTLEPGKLADFVVMDQDLFTIEEDKIPLLMPSSVYVNGKLVAGKN